MNPNPIRSAPRPRLVMATVAALLLPACNAVFGLEDRSFGSGGAPSSTGPGPGQGGTTATTGEASGGGGGSATSSGSDAVSSAFSGATSSSTSTGSGEPCALEDIARAGLFDAGWEGAWTWNDVDAFIQQAGDQPVLHAIVDGEAKEGSVTNTPAAAPACVERCIRSQFSFFANSNFQLFVYLESYDDPPAPRIGLYDVPAAANGSFLIVGEFSVACRLPAEFQSVDALVFQALEGGDFLLDDVVLEVSECPDEADDCVEI